GAAGGEEHRLHVLRRELDELVGELDGGDVRRACIAGVVGQLAHLVGGRLPQLLASMTDIDVPESRETVDIVTPLDVGEHGAPPAHVDHRLEMLARVVQRVDEVILVVLDALRGLERHRLSPRVWRDGEWNARARAPGSRRREWAGPDRAARDTSICRPRPIVRPSGQLPGCDDTGVLPRSPAPSSA